MKIRDVIRILEGRGFRLKRWRGGSHREFEGVVDGRRRLVTVAGKEGADVAQGTLRSMVRQSGLPRSVFRRQ